MTISWTTWSAAKRLLESVLPGCVSFLPDRIAEAVAKQGVPFPFTAIDGWDEMTDIEIGKIVLPSKLDDDDDLTVVTDSSYAKACPFALKAGSFGPFAEWHQELYGESVFNGDVVIVCAQRACIAVFHHSGFCATAELASPQ